MSVVVAAAAVVSAVGLSLAETAAATRARLAGMHEIDWLDRDFEPYVVASVPDEGLPALAETLVAQRLQAREARMLRLAHAALADLFEGLPPEVPVARLLLGLPEHHTTRPIDPAAFLERLALQASPCFDLEHSLAAARGRAAGLLALRQALALIDAGELDFVLVGGVDSLIDLYVLGTLDRQRRIRGDTVSDGLTPGEGAAFLLLASSRGVEACSLSALARVDGAAAGREAGHLYSPDPYLGDGLAGVISSLIEMRQSREPLRTVYCSFNGERYWAREFGVARTRNATSFSDEVAIEHPAECFGDLGAAHGAALAALAAHGLSKGYRPGPILVYASSDHADRAAATFVRTPGNKGAN